jgi:hypothetical protein
MHVRHVVMRLIDMDLFDDRTLVLILSEAWAYSVCTRWDRLLAELHGPLSYVLAVTNLLRIALVRGEWDGYASYLRREGAQIVRHKSAKLRAWPGSLLPVSHSLVRRERGLRTYTSETALLRLLGIRCLRERKPDDPQKLRILLREHPPTRTLYRLHCDLLDDSQEWLRLPTAAGGTGFDDPIEIEACEGLTVVHAAVGAVPIEVYVDPESAPTRLSSHLDGSLALRTSKLEELGLLRARPWSTTRPALQEFYQIRAAGFAELLEPQIALGPMPETGPMPEAAFETGPAPTASYHEEEFDDRLPDTLRAMMYGDSYYVEGPSLDGPRGVRSFSRRSGRAIDGQ